MKRLPLILALLCFGLIAGSSVSAATPPPAQTLLNRAQGAFVTNRTVHLDMTLQESVAQVSRVSSHIVADIAPGSNVAIEQVTFHAVSLNKRTPSKDQSFSFIVVKAKAAIHTSKGW